MSSISQMISDTASQYGVDPTLALEVATQESRLNPAAVSPAGAVGVFQLMPATAAGLGVDPTDLQQNITGGVLYLRQLLDKFGDVSAALAAYNWGPGNVTKAQTTLGAGYLAAAPAETQNYVSTILGNLGTEYNTTLGLPITAAGIDTALGQVESLTGLSAESLVMLALVGLGLYFAFEVFSE